MNRPHTPENGLGFHQDRDQESADNLVLSYFRETKSTLSGKKESGELSEAEFIQELNEVRWEILIELNSTKVNEGTQAVILSIDDHEISDYLLQDPELTEEERRELQQVADPESVLKLFKIFKRGSAKAEMEKHQRAYEIIQQSAVSQRVKVPRLVMTDKHELHIKNPELFASKVGISPSERVEFLAMEEVDGIDLASFVCQKAIIKRLRENVNEGYAHPHLFLLQETLDYILIEKGKFDLIKDSAERSRVIRLAAQLRRAVRGNFLKVWEEDFSEKDRAELMMVYGFDKEIKALRDINQGEEQAIENYINRSRDHGLLEKLVVDLHPDVIDAKEPRARIQQFWQVLTEACGYQGLLPKNLNEDLRIAIKELHDNGFYHRDLHARNIMLDKDLQTLYIIDFGSANALGDSTNSKSNYEQAGEGSWMDDFELTTPSATGEGGLLFRLTSTAEDKPK